MEWPFSGRSPKARGDWRLGKKGTLLLFLPLPDCLVYATALSAGGLLGVQLLVAHSTIGAIAEIVLGGNHEGSLFLSGVPRVFCISTSTSA